MHANLFLLILLFFAITPNLGFFNIPSFIVVLFVTLYSLFTPKAEKKDRTHSLTSPEPLIFVLLFFSALFYGGLYQQKLFILTAQSFFIVFIASLWVYFQKKSAAFNFDTLFRLLIIVYTTLAVVTIFTSPAPVIDAFYVLKEAPLQLLSGQNPYAQTFTQVYQNVKPDYYNYLPFSFIYALPFVLLFGDPRFGIIFATAASALLLRKIFMKTVDKRYLALFISLFLFLPRSFYMLEHTYLDQVLFFFFLLFVYLDEKKSPLAFFSLSLFFSIKQNLLVTLPFILTKKVLLKLKKPQNLTFLIAPLSLILVFLLWNKSAFLNDVIFSLNPEKITSPIAVSLTMATFLKLFPKVSAHANFFSIILFFISYCILFIKKINWTEKVFLSLLFFYFFSYHAFFNSYYLVSLFILFAVMRAYSSQNEIK